MKYQQRQSLFEILAQTGLVLVFLGVLLTIIKPFFPDQWVVQFASFINSDFDKLAELAVQILGCMNAAGLACSLLSILTHEA